MAVLPFENLTGDPEQAYLSDGLTEEMITRLGALNPSGLKVIARTSSMRFQDRTTPVNEIGKQLGVDYLLEGSTRREGNRVRLTATLVDVHDQSQKWSGSYEREMESILALQSDIAFGVAKSLAVALLPAQQARLAGTRSVNPEAYEAYLKAATLEFTLSPKNLDSAERFFNAALEKDPTYALAYVGIAGVWIGRQQTGGTSRGIAAPKIKSAIAKALELDDTLADAHFRLAEQYAWTDWNWAAAGREFQRAIDLDPSQSSTRAAYVDYLLIQHRPNEAMAQGRRSVELDPLSAQAQTFYGRVLMFTRHYDQAAEQYRIALQLEPNQQVALSNRRVLLHLQGKFDDALNADRAWTKTAARGGEEMAEALERDFRESGYRGAMRQAADTQAARAAATNNASVAFNTAQFYIRAGENDRALDWLEKSLAAHDPGLPYVHVSPIWDPLRNKPRFQALLRQMNLTK